MSDTAVTTSIALGAIDEPGSGHSVSICAVAEAPPCMTPFEMDRHTAVSWGRLHEVFDTIVVSSGLDFSYLQGECHNRAHFLYLLLRSKGIDAFKVWNIAPGKVLARTDGQLIAYDRNKLAPRERIVWGFHVAVALRVKTDAGRDPEAFVLDPALCGSGPLRLSAWRAQIGPPGGVFAPISGDWYLFGEGDGSGTLTFFRYEEQSRNEGWMESGLAVNSVAAEAIQSLGTRDDPALRTLLGDINELTIELQRTDAPADDPLAAWRTRYVEARKGWVERVSALLDVPPLETGPCP